MTVQRAIDFDIVRRLSQTQHLHVVAKVDGDVVSPGFEKNGVPVGIELARIAAILLGKKSVERVLNCRCRRGRREQENIRAEVWAGGIGNNRVGRNEHELKRIEVAFGVCHVTDIGVRRPGEGNGSQDSHDYVTEDDVVSALYKGS